MHLRLILNNPQQFTVQLGCESMFSHNSLTLMSSPAPAYEPYAPSARGEPSSYKTTDCRVLPLHKLEKTVGGSRNKLYRGLIKHVSSYHELSVALHN